MTKQIVMSETLAFFVCMPDLRSWSKQPDILKILYPKRFQGSKPVPRDYNTVSKDPRIQNSWWPINLPVDGWQSNINRSMIEWRFTFASFLGNFQSFVCLKSVNTLTKPVWHRLFFKFKNPPTLRHVQFRMQPPEIGFALFNSTKH